MKTFKRIACAVSLVLFAATALAAEPPRDGQAPAPAEKAQEEARPAAPKTAETKKPDAKKPAKKQAVKEPAPTKAPKPKSEGC